jgi:hypothetical protein
MPGPTRIPVPGRSDAPPAGWLPGTAVAEQQPERTTSRGRRDHGTHDKRRTHVPAHILRAGMGSRSRRASRARHVACQSAGAASDCVLAGHRGGDRAKVGHQGRFPRRRPQAARENGRVLLPSGLDRSRVGARRDHRAGRCPWAVPPGLLAAAAGHSWDGAARTSRAAGARGTGSPAAGILGRGIRLEKLPATACERGVHSRLRSSPASFGPCGTTRWSSRITPNT